MDTQMDGWTDDECIDGYMYGWIDGSMDRWIYICMDGEMNGWLGG